MADSESMPKPHPISNPPAPHQPSTVGVTVLGATGSIGRQSLDILARHPDKFHVHALSARARWSDLLEPCRRFAPRLVVLEEADAAAQLREALLAQGSTGIEVLSGRAGLAEASTDAAADVIVAAIAGFAGAEPVLQAAQAGKTILLANKESVVVAGHLLKKFFNDGSANILPVDSEHNAIYQCLPDLSWRVGQPLPSGISRLVLTASGGPFYGRDPDELATVTPDEACAHPNWAMGRKISIDSATMANKALELIECSFLFDCPQTSIDILVHRQSVIHAMVVHCDGSVTSQLSSPDMRVAISYALARALQQRAGRRLPERLDCGVQAPDWSAISSLDVHPLDEQRYALVASARRALDEGPAAQVTFNAANEELVGLFLQERLPFNRIGPAVVEAMDNCQRLPVDNWEQICAQDASARLYCQQMLNIDTTKLCSTA